MKQLSDLLPAQLTDAEARSALATAAARAGELVPRDDKPKHKISKRANGVWQRWLQFYGASKLEAFGDWPGPDLCEMIDGIRTLDNMRMVLATVRQQHPVWPPTAGELAQIIERVQPTESVDRSKLWDEVIRYIARKHWHEMTFQQQRGMVCTNSGVQVPADGDRPGFFVTFEDAANGA